MSCGKHGSIDQFSFWQSSSVDRLNTALLVLCGVLLLVDLHVVGGASTPYLR